MSEKTYVLIEVSDPKSGKFHASEHDEKEIQVAVYNLMKEDSSKVHNIDNSIFDYQHSINIPGDLKPGYYVVLGELMIDDDDNVAGITGKFVSPLSVFDSVEVEDPQDREAPDVMYA